MTLYSGDRKQVLSFSDMCVVVYLDEDDTQTFTIPGDSSTQYIMTANLNTDQRIFIGCNAYDNGSIGDFSLEFQLEFKPYTDRYVKGGDILSFITPDTTAVFGVSLRTLS